MPYALCADVHLHNWTMFASTNENGVNTRLAHIIAELNRLADVAGDTGCQRVYVAGDMFHVRGAISPSVINAALPAMRLAADRNNIKWILIPGNHDLEGRDTERLGSAIETLQCEDIMVASDVGCHLDDQVAWIPWYNDKTKFFDKGLDLSKKIKAQNRNPKDFDVLVHVGIDGVLSSVPGHFTTNELADMGFRRVFSGHYHAHKFFNVNGKHVVSIGALTHQTFSDVDTKAGFLIVNRSTFDHYESKAPKFMNWSAHSHVNERSIYARNYVRVTDVDLDEDGIKQLFRELTAAGALGVTINVMPRNKVTQRANATQQSATIEQSIGEWITLKKHDPEVHLMALDVLREARATS